MKTFFWYFSLKRKVPSSTFFALSFPLRLGFSIPSLPRPCPELAEGKGARNLVTILALVMLTTTCGRIFAPDTDIPGGCIWIPTKTLIDGTKVAGHYEAVPGGECNKVAV